MQEVSHEHEVLEFIKAESLGNCRKRRNKLLAMSPQAFAAFKLNSRIAQYCKVNFDLPLIFVKASQVMDLKNAFEEYMHAKEEGILPSSSIFSNLLSLSAGFGDQGSGSCQTRESDPPNDLNAACQVFSDMNDRNIPLTESSYTAMIRCYCTHNKVAEALALYEQMKILHIVPKLRTFNPLLKLFAKTNNTDICGQLYNEMTETFNLIPTEKEYISMLSSYSTHQSDGFCKILRDMMEDVYIPSAATWKIITYYFSTTVTGYAVSTSSISKEGRVTLTGDQLLSIDLQESTRSSLLTQIEQLATSESACNIGVQQTLRPSVAAQTEENPSLSSNLFSGDANITDQSPTRKRKFYKAIPADSRLSFFLEFKKWLDVQNESADTVHHSDALNSLNPTSSCSSAEYLNDESKSEGSKATITKWKYDVILDGANIGYFKQNYSNAPGHVDYNQIHWVVNQLQLLNYKPLVMLHCRHVDLKHLNLSQEHRDIISLWRTSHILYTTPSGCNDDWYWLYAAVYYKCKVVTNDEMRDHHFQMLSPRFFFQWKERSQIHFKFGDWSNRAADLPVVEQNTTSNNATRESEIENENTIAPTKWRVPLLLIPLPYSHRVQSIICDSLTVKGTRYYFPPHSDSENQEWLCVYASRE